jgi:N utilization substance protein A
MSEFYEALLQIEREKGIEHETLLKAIEDALLSAYKKHFGAATKNVTVKLDPKTGEAKILTVKRIVEDVKDSVTEISLSEALITDPKAKVGDLIEVESTPKSFGRIAAQTAKQVIVQRIKEAERELAYEKYKNRAGEIISGVVQRVAPHNILVNIDGTEAILPAREQSPKDHYSVGNRIKSYVLDVKKTPKGPQIILSRTYPEFVKKLFEMEVPEIYEGIVEIKSVSRDPGYRSKIAVNSKEANIDPVGTCVGMGGTRVQTIVNELNGEKIDIIEYNDNPEIFIKNSLNPAEVLEVQIDESEGKAIVKVPNEQLSLAIGKEGQNVRLAAKLTGWKIDIRGEEEEIDVIPGIGSKLKEKLCKSGFSTVRSIAEAPIERLSEIPGIGERKAQKILMGAKEIIARR